MPYHMPSTKPHQQWCDFVLAAFSSPYHTCRSGWCFCVVIIFLTPYHMPNTKRRAHWLRFVVSIFPTPHHMPSMKPHLRWCRFVFGVFSLPYHICQTRNHTLVGVILCSDSFLAPRMNFEGCLLNIFIYY